MELTRMVRPKQTADGLVTQHVFVLLKPQETPLGDLFLDRLHQLCTPCVLSS